MNTIGEWSLSPAFDLCHAYRPSSTWVSQHCLSVNGKRTNIHRNDLLEVAKSMNIKRANEIIDQINEVVSKWNTYADQQKVDPKLSDAIRNTLLEMKSKRT